MLHPWRVSSQSFKRSSRLRLLRRWQTGVAAVRALHISFKDINEQPDALATYGASVDDVRRRLHATDESGRLIVGADVAIAIWNATPGDGWLASLFGNPAVLPVNR